LDLLFFLNGALLILIENFKFSSSEVDILMVIIDNIIFQHQFKIFEQNFDFIYDEDKRKLLDGFSYVFK
jgi:hypothetical protein